MTRFEGNGGGQFEVNLRLEAMDFFASLLMAILRLR
jgi:hypothetical protein